jgi:hypothetical protein
MSKQVEAIDPIDLRTFPAVPPLTAVPDSYRQTFLAKYTECPRSAYLYAKYNGGALSHPLAGGTLLHRAVERFILLLIERNERMGPPELAKDILNEVLVESTDLTVSPDRFDSLRSMMYHVAEGLRIDPAKWICLETSVSLDINGRRVTGTIDYAEGDPRSITVFDWKSAFYNAERLDDEDEEYVPTKEEWPGTFQLVLYALSLAEGSIDGIDSELGQVPEFRLKQVHPRQFWENKGEMAYREAVISRDALLDWRLYLEAVVASVDAAFDSWEFPAIIGHHCDYCPASAECPIPAPLREFRGEIRTEEDAIRAAILWERSSNYRKTLWEAIKGYAKATGRPIRYGKDLELRWKKIESEKLKDKVNVPGSGEKVKGRVGLRAAIARAEDIGIPVPWEDFFSPSVSTRLTRKTLTPNELAAEKTAAREQEAQ